MLFDFKMLSGSLVTYMNIFRDLCTLNVEESIYKEFLGQVFFSLSFFSVSASFSSRSASNFSPCFFATRNLSEKDSESLKAVHHFDCSG